jgi:hypothetical protein
MIRIISSRRIRLSKHVARMGEKRIADRVSVGKPEGKGPLGRARRGLEDDVEMDFREIGWGGME